MPYKDPIRNKEYHKKYREEHRKIARLKYKDWYEKNRTKKLEKERIYWRTNRDKKLQQQAQWRKKNKHKRQEHYARNIEKIRIYYKSRHYRDLTNKRIRERLKNDIEFRIGRRMGTLIYQALKNNKNGQRWENIVGYNLQDLIKNLESKFDAKMNWKNYGSYWSIDHIKPKSLFNYLSYTEPQFKNCWSLNNLQPLEKIENIKKGNSYTI